MSNDGRMLANIVKNVHKRLRQEFYKTGDMESVWMNHCGNMTCLKKYASSMHKLATEHWEQLRVSNPATSRINWTWSFLQYYFFTGGLELHRQKSNSDAEWPKLILKESKVTVLDVGSCYNPFGEYEELDVLSIDLCPAIESVYQCDFLKVPLGKTTVIDGQNVLSLATNQFHCIVFSFLLEYFPSPSQRWTCCEKAQQLLLREGILIIITPDSKAAHSNAKVMRSWREALSAIGFKRIKYEKLQHAHCMAFRKNSVEPELKAEDRELLASKMYIPQDFYNPSDSSENEEKDEIKFTEAELAEGFTNLPMFDE
uniref:S-adenosylmethionine sensor upstream of mTORC1 n=1 Tax=Daphnia sinensis TaxID=1820382 RepID=A0A4Y7NAQ3_9CRUS|nr:EOG090X0FUY [Daphnia sinensis]SVE89585.1 EOG090X0FUY [Daphnia sinensis]SVE90210.1 EOG090X0FUY [Daphnia sinensis]SVE90839.1 EOG090X0FUY [Daphnia sinensis]SVE92088.1 EOG090X0FUY [Daphnia sinensis]